MSAGERVALVVGGASGIGEASARALAESGLRVAVADRDVEGGRRVAASLPSAPGLAVSCDVTRREEVDAAVEAVAARLGRLDVLVCCAGIIDPAPSDQLTDEALLRMLDVHLCGLVRCARAAYPHLRAASQPALVAVSSVGAHLGIPHRLSYCAAKGGIEAVVRTLAVEWAPDGIRVNAVAPGWALTPVITRAIDSGHLDVSALEALVPLGRLAEPDEIAHAIAFLASPAASYVSGESLRIDGALTVRGPWPQGLAPARAGAR